MAIILAILGLWVLLWSVPLGLAVRRYRHEPDPTGIFRGVLLVLIGAITAAAFGFVLSIYVDYVWFAEVQNQAARFWTELSVYIWLFVIFGLVAGAVATVTSYASVRSYGASNSTALFGAAAYGLLALIAVGSLSAGVDWSTVVQYQNFTPTTDADPIFGKPLSFYLFELPFYEMILRNAWLTLLVAAIPVGLACVIVLNRHGGRLPSIWFGTALVLTSVLFVLLGLSYWLGNYGLMTADNGVVQGVDYLNHTITINAYNVLFAIAIVGAVGVLGFGVFVRSNPAAPVFVAGGVGGVFVVAWLVYLVSYGIYSYAYVTPNHVTLNQPYIKYTMDATRRAFNLTDGILQSREFAIEPELTAEHMVENRATLERVRIWDYQAYLRRIANTNTLKPFYGFEDVDLDRYTDEQGVTHPVLIALREVDRSKLNERADTWVNRYLKYTHGYGIVASPVNEYTGNGEPVYFARGFNNEPTVPWLTVTEPRVYFGHEFTAQVYVNTTEPEIDRPAEIGEGNLTNFYACKGGVKLNSFMRRLSAFWTTGDHRIMLSSYFTPESRMLYHRKVTGRIGELVPFMELDPDWYVVVHEGRLVAVQDLYTTSDAYPYAEEIGDHRYIRPAAKATMDLCDGIVDFYVFDGADPIMQTYMAAFPEMFKPRDAMPEGLQQHIRYPEYYFNHQYVAYASYHVDDLDEFYQGTDRWTTPTEQYRNESVPLQARYIMAELDSFDGPQFMLMRPYVFEANGRRRMTGWLAGLSDGDNYGKLIAYRFPKDVHVDGPEQIEQRISSHQPFAESFRNWERGDAFSFRGNLIVVPLKTGQLLAFEPIYVKADEEAIPELVRVISVQLRPGEQDSVQIVWGETYAKSRDALLGYAQSVGLLAEDDDGSELTDEELLQLVFEHLEQHRQLTGQGQFGEAGLELQQLYNRIEERFAAQSPAVPELGN